MGMKDDDPDPAKLASGLRDEVEMLLEDIKKHESELAETRLCKRDKNVEVTHEYLKDLDDIEPGDLQSYLDEHISYLEKEIVMAKADLKTAEDERIKFWINTFRDCTSAKWEGTIETMILYDRIGHQFEIPTKAEISNTLITLDNSSDKWELENLFRFYDTLESNFPARLRHNKRAPTKQEPKKSSKAGCCFGVVAILVLIGVIFSILTDNRSNSKPSPKPEESQID